jgi:hypothetical protein
MDCGMPWKWWWKRRGFHWRISQHGNRPEISYHYSVAAIIAVIQPSDARIRTWMARGRMPKSWGTEARTRSWSQENTMNSTVDPRDEYGKYRGAVASLASVYAAFEAFGEFD